jgi:hypothetical protein
MERAERGSSRCGCARRASVAPALALLLASASAQASPGILTSAQELAAIRAAADAGRSPEAQESQRMIQDARRPWRWGSVSGEYVTTALPSKTCHPADDPASDYLLEGAPDAYAQAIGALLTGDPELAAQAREHVLDLVDTSGFHGLAGDYDADNQCILDLALSIPIWIETARLLEDTPVWSADDAAAFQAWLAKPVYPRVAWASRVRRNNWGAAGSLSAYSIARYVEGGVASLEEVAPESRSLAPSAAADAHTEMQRLRIGHTWVGDARCPELGIQPHGGIPEELRRGSTGCDGTYLVADDNALAYQTMHVELLVLHAEALRRLGDPSLYRLEAAPGVPAILQAIRFVIANSSPGGRSWPWKDSRWGALVVAASFYGDPVLTEAARGGSTFRGGRTLPYARFTALAPPLVADPDAGPVGQPGKPMFTGAS